MLRSFQLIRLDTKVKNNGEIEIIIEVFYFTAVCCQSLVDFRRLYEQFIFHTAEVGWDFRKVSLGDESVSRWWDDVTDHITNETETEVNKQMPRSTANL